MDRGFLHLPALIFSMLAAAVVFAGLKWDLLKTIL